MSDALANGQEAARPDRRRSVHARVRRPGSRRPLPRPGRRHDPDARRLHARLAHQINVDNGTKFTLLTGFQQTECCSSSFARSFCAGARGFVEVPQTAVAPSGRTRLCPANAVGGRRKRSPRS